MGLLPPYLSNSHWVDGQASFMTSLSGALIQPQRLYMDHTKRDSGIFIQMSDCNQLIVEPPYTTREQENFHTTDRRPKYLLPHLQ
eukprot:9933181-Ditylum_brightwellii.AAC.1